MTRDIHEASEGGFEPKGAAASAAAASVIAALSVYVEPLVADARVAIFGDFDLGFHERVVDLGARSVHLYDPDATRVARVARELPRGVLVRSLREAFEVRDAAFDLIVVPDIGALPKASTLVPALARILDARGSLVAMGRARTSAEHDASFPELSSASVEYAELYDWFAREFERVLMTGVLPFRGVVFAELGGGDDLTVSVDTRLVEPAPPGVFVVLASREEERAALDPYAIVQVERASSDSDTHGRDSELLARVAHADRQIAELSSALSSARHVQSTLERRLRRAEEERAERDEALSRLAAELVESRTQAEEIAVFEQTRMAALAARLDDASEAVENVAALQIAAREAVSEREALAERLSQVEDELAEAHRERAAAAELHARETAEFEAHLRDRASVIATLEAAQELRDQVVNEALLSVESMRANEDAFRGDAPAPSHDGAAEEVLQLRAKLDALALAAARAEGELAAQAWRITELEHDNARLAQSAAPVEAPPVREHAALLDELDALRQALTQEHAARVQAEAAVPTVVEDGAEPAVADEMT
jgi:hypothetical protein